MKAALFWISTLLLFGIVNGMIARKEATIRQGATMLLEIGPRDPRSLMQGDYMALRYRAMEQDQLHRALDDAARHGQLVVRLDGHDVATFERLHRGEPLAANEHLLRYHWTGGLHVAPTSFFFQEGHARHYAAARYAELKVSPDGESVLVALRNADFQRAGP